MPPRCAVGMLWATTWAVRSAHVVLLRELTRLLPKAHGHLLSAGRRRARARLGRDIGTRLRLAAGVDEVGGGGGRGGLGGVGRGLARAVVRRGGAGAAVLLLGELAALSVFGARELFLLSDLVINAAPHWQRMGAGRGGGAAYHSLSEALHDGRAARRESA